MKVLKAKIYVTHPNDSSTQFYYPDVWIQNKEKIDLNFHNERADEEVDEKGTYKTFFLVVKEDDVAQTILKDEQFSETTMEEFCTSFDKIHPQKVVTIDQNKVNEVLIKKALGQEVSKEDSDSIDPNVDGGAVRKTEDGAQIIEKYGLTF